jgi:perosamine synthetase
MIPLSKPWLTETEAKNVYNSVKSGWLTQSGAEVILMEENLTNYAHSSKPHLNVAATSNGSTALHLALMACGIGRGDEVLVPDFSYAATINAILLIGATPVLIKPNKLNFNMDLEYARIALNDRTKAIIAVDNYGNFEQYSELRNLVDPKVKIIQDAAESFPNNLTEAGNLFQGDLTTTSFYANKVITSGEGGAVFANHETIAEIKILRNQGVEKAGEFSHARIGYNYRINNLSASIFNSQWMRRYQIINNLEYVYKCYLNLINEIILDDFEIQLPNMNSNRWLFTIRIPGLERVGSALIREKLKQFGIETRPGFMPFSQMKIYEDSAIQRFTDKVAMELRNSIISLPTFPEMTFQEIEFIVKSLNFALREN